MNSGWLSELHTEASSQQEAILRSFEEGIFGAALSTSVQDSDLPAELKVADSTASAVAPAEPAEPAATSAATSALSAGKRKRPEKDEVVLGASSAPLGRKEMSRRHGDSRILQNFTRPGPVTVISRPPPDSATAAPLTAADSQLSAAGFAAPPGVSVVCKLCMRGFESEAKLRRHEEVSELHKQNLAKQSKS